MVSNDLNPYTSPKAVGAADRKTGPARPEAAGPAGLSPLRVVCGWFVGAGMLGCALGLANGAVRPFLEVRRRWDAMLTLCVLISICASLTYWLSRRPPKAALWRYEMATIALWVGHAVGYFLARQSLWSFQEDLVLLHAFPWLMVALTGATILLAPHRRKIRKRQ